MISQKEYKKLRAQGYRAITAKQICSHPKEPLHNLSCLPDGQLVVVRNGFRFIVEMKIDEDPFLLDDLGTFTDDYEPGAIAHKQNDRTSFNWFVPANIGDAKGLTDTGMDKQSAHLEIQKYAQQNYRRACSYGDEWAYYDLHIMAYLDQPEMMDHCLVDNWTGGIDYEFGKRLGNYVGDIIEEQIHDLLPEAFKKLAELNQMFSKLTIGLEKPRDINGLSPKASEKVAELNQMFTKLKATHDPKVVQLARELREFAATFVVMYEPLEITPQIIEEWCNGTSSDASDADEYMDLLPEGYDLDEWVQDVYDHADALAEYYKENP